MRRLVTVAVVGLGSLLLAWGGVMTYLVAQPRVASYWHRIPFESHAWKSRSADDGVMWPTRLRMAVHLIGGRVLDGLPRRDVVALLGDPDETAKWRDWDLVYYRGPERGLFSIDSEWLVIRLGPTGIVSDYRIVTD
jgi:hypothetical protein